MRGGAGTICHEELAELQVTTIRSVANQVNHFPPAAVLAGLKCGSMGHGRPVDAVLPGVR